MDSRLHADVDTREFESSGKSTNFRRWLPLKCSPSIWTSRWAGLVTSLGCIITRTLGIRGGGRDRWFNNPATGTWTYFNLFWHVSSINDAHQFCRKVSSQMNLQCPYPATGDFYKMACLNGCASIHLHRVLFDLVAE